MVLCDAASGVQLLYMKACVSGRGLKVVVAIHVADRGYEGDWLSDGL